MPTYEYQCKECGKSFEQTLTVREHEQGRKPSCPKCRSKRTEQQISRFQTVTSSKA